MKTLRIKLPRTKKAKRERFSELAAKEALETITPAELVELEALDEDRDLSQW